MNLSVMFMDCPAYLDKHGTVRCGLPAAVGYRYTVSTVVGPIEAARIRCPRGHRLNGPIEALTWEKHPSVSARTRTRLHELVTSDVRRAARLLDLGLRSFNAGLPPADRPRRDRGWTS